MDPQEYQKLLEERRRLDDLRNIKFKIIADAMAKHKIDERNSEYDESVFNSFAFDQRASNHADPRGQFRLGSQRFNNHGSNSRNQRSQSNPRQVIDES